MKKAFSLLAMVFVLVFLSGCGSQTKTIDTGDGSVTVNSGDNPSSWCQTGADWNYQGDDGQEGSWEIVELVSSGKYEGLCHVKYSGMGTEMDYYFNEEGNSGYVEMTMPNGETITQSWEG